MTGDRRGRPKQNPPKVKLYQRTASTLRERISYGYYPANEMLPTEMTLATEFGVSRHTMREALKALVAEGQIERTPGRGTVISPRSTISGAWGIKSLDELIGEFDLSGVNVLYKGTVAARQHPRAAEVLRVAKTGSLFQLKRVLSNRQGPASVNTLFTLVKFANRIPPEHIGPKPLIALLEEHCRIVPVRSRQIASATAADAEAARLLGVPPGSPLLVLRRTYIDVDDRPLEYTELVSRPDRYQQSVDFMRDRTIRGRP